MRKQECLKGVRVVAYALSRVLTWTCSEFLSATEYTAIVFRPSSLQARMTRTAISPRLAMSTFWKFSAATALSCVRPFGARMAEATCRWPPLQGRLSCPDLCICCIICEARRQISKSAIQAKA